MNPEPRGVRKGLYLGKEFELYIKGSSGFFYIFYACVVCVKHAYCLNTYVHEYIYGGHRWAFGIFLCCFQLTAVTELDGHCFAKGVTPQG